MAAASPAPSSGLDVTGEDVEATGLVWSVGDADRMCRPIAGTLVRAPWMSRPGAQVLMTMYEADGQPCFADPRHALARAVERLQRLGLRPVVAAEIEFYLVAKDAQGRLGPAPGLLSQRAPQRLDSMDSASCTTWRRCSMRSMPAARTQGLPLRTLMSEYAPGQYEITLLHRNDALRAIDDAILFKRLIRATALRHGLTACFMAKPFADQAGSGMHMHVSLQDEQRQQCVRRRRSGRHAAASTCHRRPAKNHGREHADVRAECEFLSTLSPCKAMRRWRRPGESTIAR